MAKSDWTAFGEAEEKLSVAIEKALELLAKQE